MALWGLREVHNEGLVYYDFKMENILLTGFDNENAPSDDESVPLMLYAKLADLGSVMAPSRGEVTSIAYRSPEVYFNKPWTSAIDIWAWGIACFHLLQARINFSSHGVYDCIIKDGMLEQKANAVRTVQCHDFNVRSNEYFQNCNCSICDKVNVDLGDERWTDRLVAQGGSGV
ncbi:hypothetical protein SI65_02611 [Aspergillus cristatus]|uniref:Protein kinase domain-containing protein n=1 Tax=Aspergillus cristatus TaxID=573508 RepID=A0A1E3BLI8_ASPCR|nr:hypothetical protein SI65_02611 [Aspergillus cristatus]